MAGHSKAKNIQHRKGRQDKIKSAKNTHYALSIYNIVKSKGEHSIEAKSVIERAKAISIPNEVIQRAIQKANNKDEIAGEVIFYAAMKHPIYLIIKTCMSNKNKFSYIKSALTKYDFEVTTISSCEYLFNYSGILILKKNEHSFDDICLLFIDYSEDIREDIDNDYVIIIATIENYQNIVNIVMELNYEILYINIGYCPLEIIECVNIESFNGAMDTLCNNIEVQEIYTNLDFMPIVNNND